MKQTPPPDFLSEKLEHNCTLQIGKDCENHDCPFYMGAAGCAIDIHFRKLAILFAIIGNKIDDDMFFLALVKKVAEVATRGAWNG